MIERVLVPMNESEMSAHALRHAIEAHPDAEITVLYVAGELSGMMGEATSLALAEDTDAAAEDAAGEVFESARDIADELGVEISTTVELGHPARVIINTAEEFDTLVIGSHSGGIVDRLFVGNVAEKVVRNSPVPVTVVR